MVEEDNFSFAALAAEPVYPVFCQPVLVELNTVDENTKFIKFSLNKAVQGRANAEDWELLRDAARVFWRSERPYAFCHVCPAGVTNKSGPVEAVTTIETKELGLYKQLNKTDEEQRGLSTRVTADLVLTQVKSNTKTISQTPNTGPWKPRQVGPGRRARHPARHPGPPARLPHRGEPQTVRAAAYCTYCLYLDSRP
jgi:hypothetical protein